MKVLLTAAVLAIGPVVVAPSAQARPMNEGGDTRRCVTYAEAQAVYLGASRARIERIIDTRGHRVAVADLEAAMPAGADLGPGPRQRMVRAYPNCPDAGVVTDWFLVEYNEHTRRERVTAVVFDG